MGGSIRCESDGLPKHASGNHQLEQFSRCPVRRSYGAGGLDCVNAFGGLR